MADKTMRTEKGTVTQKARDKFGAKDGKGMREGSFPVFDRRSATSALKLRGHAPDPSAVVAKVAAWAAKNNDMVVAMKARLARKQDSPATGKKAKPAA